jgi:cytochrome c heme-lyase
MDPTNQMPTNPNQLPSPGQQIALPTERISSSIPKGGTYDGTWLYPSPQMFWNAMVRKNKTPGSKEEDMLSVVAVHNNMNENTWRQVLAWEDLYPKPIDVDLMPKLLRFQGRPDDLSPKAWLKSLFGHPKPFDRHGYKKS